MIYDKILRYAVQGQHRLKELKSFSVKTVQVGNNSDHLALILNWNGRSGDEWHD